MKRLALAGLFALGVLFMGALPSPRVVTEAVLAARPTTDNALMLLLNGVPVRIGVLTSTGTSVNQGTTAVTFTVTSGTVLEVVCDGAAFVSVGATASSDYTNANFGRPMSAGVSRWFVLRDSDTDLSLDTAGSTVNCNVSVMR